jgi:hypothetical protein
LRAVNKVCWRKTLLVGSLVHSLVALDLQELCTNEEEQDRTSEHPAPITPTRRALLTSDVL